VRSSLIIIGIILAATLAVAIHTQETRYAVTPSTTEQRNIYFSQNRYGANYTALLGNFGKKGASRGNFGFKGDSSAESNLPYNDYIPQGSNPRKISNYYASSRGYKIIDTTVYLEGNSLVSRPGVTTLPKGTARVISMHKRSIGLPHGTVFMRVKDLPPVGDDEIYEGWLVDEDSGYSLSMGIFLPATIGRINSLTFDIDYQLNAFDYIMVAREQYPDTDPRPGVSVMTGVIS